MIRLVFLALTAMSLAACREEVAEIPNPTDMTADAVGHYCQMNILEHAGPKAQIHLAGLHAPLFFSQVRDAIAYQRMPEQHYEILAIYVSDMGDPGATWDDPGSTNWTLAEEAHYVIGADIVGGMGAPELVPFSSRADADAFSVENGGIVLTLSEVPDQNVLAPIGVVSAENHTSAEEADFAARLRALSQEVEN